MTPLLSSFYLKKGASSSSEGPPFGAHKESLGLLSPGPPTGKCFFLILVEIPYGLPVALSGLILETGDWHVPTNGKTERFKGPQWWEEKVRRQARTV